MAGWQRFVVCRLCLLCDGFCLFPEFACQKKKKKKGLTVTVLQAPNSFVCFLHFLYIYIYLWGDLGGRGGGCGVVCLYGLYL